MIAHAGDVIHQESDAADADVIECPIGLAVGRWIDELHEVEDRCSRILAQAHEYPAQLFDFQSERDTNTRFAAAEHEIADLSEADAFVAADRAGDIAAARARWRDRHSA